VSRYQLRPQPTVAPTVSVLGEPLELRWIIHPDRHLTACGAKPRWRSWWLAAGHGAFWHRFWRGAHMGPAGQVSCTPPGGWGFEASFPAHSPMMSRTRMIHPILAHECTGFLGGRW